MKATVESTVELVRVDGALCRLWKGRSEEGTDVILFVARVAVPREQTAADAERDLKPAGPPEPPASAPIDLRKIL